MPVQERMSNNAPYCVLIQVLLATDSELEELLAKDSDLQDCTKYGAWASASYQNTVDSSQPQSNVRDGVGPRLAHSDHVKACVETLNSRRSVHA
jgi:hypothetical protein